MTVNNFIPAYWAGSVFKNLNDAHVWKNATNSDYEGEVRQGSSVKITGIGHIPIRPYSRNADIGGPDLIEDASQTLLIDQADEFNFQIDDVDAAQANVKLIGPAMEEAGWGMADVADRFLKDTIKALSPRGTSSPRSPASAPRPRRRTRRS